MELNRHYIMNAQIQETGQATAPVQQQEQHCRPQAKWAAVIDDEVIPAPRRRLEVQVLLDQASVPPGKVLVRDLESEHDLALGAAELIDLGEGNVFYTLPEHQAPKPTGRHAPPKRAFIVDDRPEETVRPDQTGRTLRELFGFTMEVELFRDYESPHDQPIGLDDPANFADGPVFYTRRHEPLTITITINGKPYVLHERMVEVRELMRMAGIPLADVLVPIVGGKLGQPLDDKGKVEVHCGEVFVSHPKDNGSS